MPPTLTSSARRRTAGELLGALRGTTGLRPKIDPGLAGGLRAWLDDGIFERCDTDSTSPRTTSTRSFASARSTNGARGVARGALVAQLIRLHVAAVDVATPLNDAADALRGSGRDGPVCQLVDALDPDERAQLAAEVRAHHEVLRDVLPRVPSRWSPRCAVRQAVVLAGGDVVSRGVVDLSLGTTGGTRACVCLVEVTTAPLDGVHERVCRYLALLETIRTGEQPLRVAAISTADGRSIVHDVTPELLAGAVEDLLAVLSQPAAA